MSDTKATSDTPLSDLIAAHITSGSMESWAQFLEGFRKSQLGLVAMGAPAGTAGEIVSSADREASVNQLDLALVFTVGLCWPSSAFPTPLRQFWKIR